MAYFSRWFGSLTLALVCLLSTQAKAKGLEDVKKRGVLKVGVEPGFLPFEMRSPKNEWLGFDVEMMKAFAQSLGVKVEFVATKWDGIIPGLMAGKYDVIASGMTITEERSKIVLFSEPYYEAGLKIMLPAKHKNLIKDLKTLDQSNFTVLVKLGTTGDIFASKTIKQAKLRKMDTEADAAQAVALGRFDAFIYDKPFIDIYQSVNADKVVSLDSLLSQETFGLAAQKSSQDLITAFNQFLKAWRASGAYDKAYRAMFIDLTWKQQFPLQF